jgi:hypothetical protein
MQRRLAAILSADLSDFSPSHAANKREKTTPLHHRSA